SLVAVEPREVRHAPAGAVELLQQRTAAVEAVQRERLGARRRDLEAHVGIDAEVRVALRGGAVHLRPHRIVAGAEEAAEGAAAAVRGRCSQMRTPLTRVCIPRNWLRTSEGASGLRSNVSSWLAAP